MIDRLPPQAIDAEKAFLGACLIMPDAHGYGEDVGLTADDFYKADNRAVWVAIERLTAEKTPVDIVTVREMLDTMKSDVTSTYLADLSGSVSMAYNAVHYARLVKDKSIRRQLIAAAGRIAELGYSEGEDVETLMDRAEAALRGARDKAPRSNREPAPDDIIARMEGEKFSGVQTRFPAINSITGGMVRGHIWVVGGFSSTGKSAIAVNLVDDVVRAGGAVMVASTEMSQEQYLLRLLSLTSGVPQRVIRHGGMTLEQSVDYDHAKEVWRKARLRVYDDLYNTTRIRRMAKKMKESIGLDVLIVDFVQNLSETGDEVRDARVAAIELQSMAKELQCCVLALSQLSNSMALQQVNEGVSANYFQFKSSGAWKDVADLAIMLDRDRNNHPDVMWIHVLKNRHDRLAKVAARFELETGRLTQMTEREMLDVDPNAGRKSRREAAATAKEMTDD